MFQHFAEWFHIIKKRIFLAIRRDVFTTNEHSEIVKNSAYHKFVLPFFFIIVIITFFYLFIYLFMEQSAL